MGFLSFLTKNKRKSFVPGVGANSTINVRNVLSQQTDLFRFFGDQQYIDFYANVAPCADAIDFLSESATAISLKISTDEEFVKNTEVELILAAPNPVQTWNELYLSLVTFFLITGNSYMCVTRSTSGKMLELFVFEPQHITIETDNTFFVNRYSYNNTRGVQRIIFHRVDKNGQIRYLTTDGVKELYHLKRFNPNEQQTLVAGTSKLRSIVYELAQDRAGSVHNLSLLQNGTRVGGLIKLKSEMGPDQEANIIAQVENKFSGARNAGRPVIASVIEDYIDTMQSNRDMDFQNLKTQITERIYRRFRIPLALIQSSSLSLANMDTAEFHFYHNAVCPLTITIYSFLTKIFNDYFSSFENQHFAYDPFSIDALRKKRLDELQIQSALNVSTDNEIRNQIDLEDYDGGNDVYKPANMIPVGEVNDEPNGG